MKSRLTRAVVVLLIVVVSVGCDQATKALARHYLPDTGAHRVVGTLFVLVYAENRGAFLSLGSNWPEPVRVALLVVISAMVLAALLIYVIRSRSIDTGTTIAFSLVVGGGIGNMVDRIFRGGFVTDFMNFGIGPVVRTGILNVADLLVTVGIVMVVVLYIRSSRKQPVKDDPS